MSVADSGDAVAHQALIATRQQRIGVELLQVQQLRGQFSGQVEGMKALGITADKEGLLILDLDDLQHQLGVADDFPLQKVLPDGQFARHDLCEDDAQNRGFRRVAWHIDAIAKTTNKD